MKKQRELEKIPYPLYIIICVTLLIFLLAGVVISSTLSKKHKEMDPVGGEKFTIETDLKLFEINSGIGNVTIRPTEGKPYIKIDEKYNMEKSVETTDGVYKIDFSTDKYFSTTFITKALSNDRVPQIDIYLNNKQLDQLKIKSGAGQLIIDGISANKLDLDVSAGNVVVKNCELDAIKTKLDAGKLEVRALNGVKTIESDVSAGTMDLFLPKNISGFICGYSVSVGKIEMKSDFELKDDDTRGFQGGGQFVYGDESCKIKLNVAIGTINIDDYE